MEDFQHFLDDCPTPYHFVSYARRELLQNGFVELNEKAHFDLDQLPNQKAFVVRDERSIIAFKLNNQSKAKSGESVVGVCANCDSPCFKLKYNYEQNPFYGEVKEEGDDENYKNAFFNDSQNKTSVIQNSNQNQKTSGYQLLRLSLYGTALWQTFFDRDLRAIHQMSHISLSPKYDPEKHFNALFNIVHDKENKTSLRSYVASLLGDDNITEDQIVDWDLRFVDANKSDNFNNLIFSAGLKNLSLCYAGLKAIISDKPLKLRKKENEINSEKQELSENTENQPTPENAGNQEDNDEQKTKPEPKEEEPVELEVDENSTDENESSVPVQILAIFDNDNAEYACRSGAKSDFLQSILTEIYRYYNNQKLETDSSASEIVTGLSIKNNSFLISCYSTHGTHPIGGSPSDSGHPSVLGKGPVIKCTTRSTLATELVGQAVVNEASKQSGVPLQLQYMRNDKSFPSTIGPHIAFKTGIRTVDIGCPILSMNSARETMNFNDIVMMTSLLSDILNHYNQYRMKDEITEDVQQND